MRSSFFTSMAQCEFGDWVGIGVLIAVGAFSLTFLIMACVLLGRYLLDSVRRKNTGTT
jgi:hypothetical protein